MMRRIAIASVLFVAAGCATQEQAQKKQQGPTTKEERMRITNQSPFDVAVCQPKTRSLPQPANQEVILGALTSARPQVLECLVDPKSRGAADTTNVTVKTTVNDQGGTHAVSGENLTPEGTACIQKVVDTQVPLTALPKGAQPVTSESSFVHETSNSASVKFGINPGSDYSGTVRLALPTWCDCYASFGNKAPPILKASVDLKKGLATAADITFDPVGTPEGDQLAACLKGKMMALPAKLETDELKFGYRFVQFNSQASEPAADLPPELRFLQLDLVRNQRSADVAIASGARTNAAEAYDAIVTKYQKSKDWKLIDELKTKCKALVDSAQGWVNAIDSQLKVDQASLAIVQELKAKDTAWADVETKSQEVIGNTEKYLANAQQRLKDDQAACPKERK
ncbi:hypothetical protein [Vitiosangium sp. GDMCC 1.1324]|uniref:hypothetical protein n=1 Tax=Vitiosangium sp. (strain GDMCC 1.1324) TaxID=2138576 RepID=UPI000D399562|nr:hypothetical protein [Vitiosangium sp. GDMCC 1.1324]PTL82572.1 hypothetical protein DAT35_17380 [Vitiosangium sp. GDMCC 1.1324]